MRQRWMVCHWTQLAMLVLLVGSLSSKPVTEFTKYRVITPKLYHGVDQTEIPTTRQQNGEHVHRLTITYKIHNKEHILDLVLNTDLIPESYFEKYQHHDGNISQKSNNEVDLCHYQGHIRGIPNSLAAISTCSGISGVIFDGDEVHYLGRNPHKLNAEEDFGTGSPHLMYSRSDMQPDLNLTCGTEGNVHESSSHTASHNNQQLKRDIKPIVREPFSANAKSRYIELVLVVDKKAYSSMKGEVFLYCRQLANIVNMVYSKLNIFVVLVGIVVWDLQDEILVSSSGSDTLSMFTKYRSDVLLKQHPNDDAFLITGEVLDVYGTAYKNVMCSPIYSSGVVEYSSIVGNVAHTLAHEMAHNIGVSHDDDGCRCNEKYCIMKPGRNKASLMWSSCSRDFIADYLAQDLDYCLHNKPAGFYHLPVCGNGFVEDGEECDCGLAASCDNPCCDSYTCKLLPGAKCATGHCCDLQQCELKPAGAHCRLATSECDLPEFCNGMSEFCPDDMIKMDGEECRNTQAFCYQGKCRTHDSQCELLWGPASISAPQVCYDTNTDGDSYGHCGNHNGYYKSCDSSDAACGLLHCIHAENSLQQGVTFGAATRQQKFFSGICESVMLGVAEGEIDPGLVPNGAKCGDGKMCFNQACIPVAQIKYCSSKCSGKEFYYELGLCKCGSGNDPPGSISTGSHNRTSRQVMIFTQDPAILTTEESTSSVSITNGNSITESYSFGSKPEPDDFSTFSTENYFFIYAITSKNPNSTNDSTISKSATESTSSSSTMKTTSSSSATNTTSSSSTANSTTANSDSTYTMIESKHFGSDSGSVMDSQPAKTTRGGF